MAKTQFITEPGILLTELSMGRGELPLARTFLGRPQKLLKQLLLLLEHLILLGLRRVTLIHLRPCGRLGLPSLRNRPARKRKNYEKLPDH
jgi:hypothetical protein